MSFDSKVKPPEGMSQLEEFRERLRASNSAMFSWRNALRTVLIQSSVAWMIVLAFWGLGASPEVAVRLALGAQCTLIVVMGALYAFLFFFLFAIAAMADGASHARRDP